MNEKEITMFSKVYPATVEALGGLPGLTRWLTGNDSLPAHAAQVFRDENTRLLRNIDEFNKVGRSDVFSVIANSLR